MTDQAKQLKKLKKCPKKNKKKISLAKKFPSILFEVSLESYLSGKIPFDSISYYQYAYSGGNGFIVLPYCAGEWTEDKLFFLSVPEIELFAKTMGAKIVTDEE